MAGDSYKEVLVAHQHCLSLYRTRLLLFYLYIPTIALTCRWHLIQDFLADTFPTLGPWGENGTSGVDIAHGCDNWLREL